MIQLRPASAADIPALESLVFNHGTNEWNYLPEDGVKAHLTALTDGSVRGFVALSDGEIVGLMTFQTGIFYPEYETNPAEVHGYVAEGVVHSTYVGKGIGVQLMQEVLNALAQVPVKHIYAKRHEENPYSRRLLEKTGFQEIATFYDPLIRPTGTRRTTVCRFLVK
ncbi:GNAT family N-acetyltransferase [Telluribacter sp.]|jgi:ribosomal protein S18 acetylase RimI-like enzyme|uniref:GNAT family N-acetyltransferase n=1 Tax=Telluribacter sp. TaxID=1978767 RepID=UPI002E14F3C3|nr:GNAT family N-acetyltransferase [Telluribacter sp.]